MKVLLDEGVPRQVAHNLRGHDVTTVPGAGWASVKNGVLLGLIEESGFRVFVTCDKNIQYQQHQLDRKPFGILVLSTNHWPSMQPYIETVVEAVKRCKPATIGKVECGRFVPRKFRKPTV